MRVTAIGGQLNGCFSSLLPAFAKHGRRKMLRILISLQLAFMVLLKGEHIFPRLVLQVKEAAL